MDGLEDAALAVRIAASTLDAEAEAEVCRRFAPRIHQYGLRHLGSEHAADDLVQEVLALVLTRLREGRLRDPAMLASFVLGTCRLIVRGERRTYARRRTLLGQLAEEHPAAVELELSAADHQLASCLGRLSERERTVITLTYYAERSGSQIADELGLSPGNVRVIRHRTLARLLACMSGSEEAS